MSTLKINIEKPQENNSFKSYSLNGYIIEKPLTSDNSGFSKWGFCRKGGVEYFIKEFVNPVYPSESVKLAEDIRQRKISQCLEWFDEKKRIYKKIHDSQTGNLVEPVSFFRSDSHFYLVTDKIEKSDLDYKTISTFDLDRKLVLLKVLSSCFMKLAKNGVVHADIKPENLLVKETKGGFLTIKVIDFDASYLEDNPPFGDDIQGDPVYYAPETFLGIMEEEVTLTPKVDVFGLGIVFHQLLCGEMPAYDTNEYDYIYECVLNGDRPQLSEKIPQELRALIDRMLSREYTDRPSMEEVLQLLSNNGKKPEPAEKAPAAEESGRGGLVMGTGLKTDADVPVKKPSRFVSATDFDL